MATIEAHRTLVKSPPELWAELSDPTSLARHLGEFGEIRIARVEAETSVEWEAESASGRVELKPSGWGTKVTLTVAREAPQPVAAEPEPEAEAVVTEPEAEAVVTEPEAEAVVTEPEAVVAKPQAEAEAEPELAPATADLSPRFFARLFRRWRREQPSVEPDPAPEAAATPEPTPTPEVHEPPLDLAAELAAELERVEATMAEQDVELLSAVLDRLGAAHHRPFSRG